MAADDILLQRRDGAVLHLTLNRPAQRNALSLALVGELQHALQQAEGDGQTRVVVLRGAGPHFCAGGDVSDMARARGMGHDAIAAVSRAFGQLCAAYAATPLATILLAEGAVMGGGFGLACVADLVLATPTAQFRLPETSLGLVPAQIAPLLVERIGSAAARRLALTGATLDAPRAHALGLVSECVDDDGLDAALQRVVADLLRAAPGAVAATKRLLAKSRLTPAAALIDEAAALFAEAVLGPEGSEGTMAFVQRRAPAWAVA